MVKNKTKHLRDEDSMYGFNLEEETLPLSLSPPLDNNVPTTACTSESIPQ